MLKESRTNEDFEYQRLSQEEQQKRGILGRLTGICADLIKPTRNGRKYSEQLWENVFNNPIMKEKIANKCCFGELGHPTDRTEIDMEKIAICLPELPIKGPDGKLRAVFDIVNTPNGRILKALCDYGCHIGISSRGEGDLITDYNGEESVDPETYSCECFDAVLIPAVKEARLDYVTESLNKKRYNKSLRQSLRESLEAASEEDRKIMEDTLKNLDIKLDEQEDNLVEVICDDCGYTKYMSTENYYGLSGQCPNCFEHHGGLYALDKEGNEVPLKEEVKLNEMAQYYPQFNVKEGTGTNVNYETLTSPSESGRIVARVKNKQEAYEFLLSHKNNVYHVDYDHFIDRDYTKSEPVFLRILETRDIPRNVRFPIYINGELNREYPVSGAINEIEDALLNNDIVFYQPKAFKKLPILKKSPENESLDLNENYVSKFFKTVEEGQDFMNSLSKAQAARLDINSDNTCNVSYFELKNDDINDKSLNINEKLDDVKSLYTIPGFGMSINDKFEDDGHTGWEVTYTKNDTDLVTVELWDEESPVSVMSNDYADNLFQRMYDSFDSFKADLVYKAKMYLGESLNINERYEFSEVDNAIKHFRNDLGKEPDVDDIISELEKQGYFDNMSFEKQQKVYHELASEISARLNDIQDESLNINEAQNTAVDNNEAIVEELQNSLKQKQELEQKVVRLQEKLSVCYAKEATIEEDKAKYKANIVKLAESAKRVSALQTRASLLEEKLNEAKENEIALKNQLVEAKQKIKITAEKNIALKESISHNSDTSQKLSESLNDLTMRFEKTKEEHIKEIKALKENYSKQLSDVKKSAEDEKNQLNKNISKLQEDISLQKEDFIQKLDKSKKLIEKYKKATATAVDKYIESQAIRLGSSINEIKNRLPESYTFKDIDKVCEDVQSYNLNMSKLPFNTLKTKSVNEGLKIKGVSSKNEAILPANSFDDDIDEDLIYLAGQN